MADNAGVPDTAVVQRLLAAQPLRVAIIGDGLAALLVARELAVPGFAVTLTSAASLDAIETTTTRVVASTGSIRVGRSSVAPPVESVEIAPSEITKRPVDAGSRITAADSAALELFDRLELEVAELADASRGLWLRGKLVPAPQLCLLGIPGSPLARDVARAVGRATAWRAWLDRLRPVLTIGQEHNLARLVRSRMGAKLLRLLVEPTAFDTFGVAAARVDVGHALPALNPALTRNGTLSGAVSELAQEQQNESRPLKLVGGQPALLAALTMEVLRRGARTSQARLVSLAAHEEPSDEIQPGVGSRAPDTALAQSENIGDVRYAGTVQRKYVGEAPDAVTEQSEDAGEAQDVVGSAEPVASGPPDDAAQADTAPTWMLEFEDGSSADFDVVILASDPVTSHRLAGLDPRLELADNPSAKKASMVVFDAAADESWQTGGFEVLVTLSGEALRKVRDSATPAHILRALEHGVLGVSRDEVRWGREHARGSGQSLTRISTGRRADSVEASMSVEVDSAKLGVAGVLAAGGTESVRLTYLFEPGHVVAPSAAEVLADVRELFSLGERTGVAVTRIDEARRVLSDAVARQHSRRALVAERFQQHGLPLVGQWLAGGLNQLIAQAHDVAGRVKRERFEQFNTDPEKLST